jgi:RNA 2',3'-cyclic 3'-phosphodiesterase
VPRPTFQHRLFIALWPSVPVARELVQLTTALHAECGGRKIIEQNQHVTVVFLGDIKIDQRAMVERAMQRAAGAPFDLQLDAIEYRKRGGLLWARALRVPDALTALVSGLRTALGELGFMVEDRAFLPHVTLLRDAVKPARATAFQAAWRVDELTLVRSHLDGKGARYEMNVAHVRRANSVLS